MNLKHATLKGSDPGRVLSATAVPAACRAGHHCRSRVLLIFLFPSRPSNFHITVALPVIPHSPAVGGKGVACTLAAGWGQARRIFSLITGFPSMQLEHAILILFSTIWPLAGLK